MAHSLKDELEGLYKSYMKGLQESESSARWFSERSERLLSEIKAAIEQSRNENVQQIARLENESLRFEREKNEQIERLKKEEQKAQREQERISETLDEYCDKFLSCTSNEGRMSERYLEAIFFLDQRLQRYYVTRPHPAMEAALTIRDYAKTNKELRLRIAEYESYLSEFLSDTEDCKPEEFERYEEDEERIRYFLSSDEYNGLSPIEKNQLALDRYLNHRHSNTWIGKMYERYIGYLYEAKGYSVYYRGIDLKQKDGGIDLECKRGDEILIVQCKCWAKDKLIYEKSIQQLFGSSEYYKKTYILQMSLFSNVSPIFITTVELDDRAKDVADKLGVKIFREEGGEKLKSYPMIKCNINQSTGERIYHLPFDQMYDKVQIKYDGECYVKTVEDAERLGFRRAKRHIL